MDRAFSVQGYGTVVAGIPVAGSARVGDELELLPQRLDGRIRRIEVYGQTSDVVLAGQCAAINIPQWDHKAVERGNVITISDYFAPHQWYLCELKLLDQEKADLKNAAQGRPSLTTGGQGAISSKRTETRRFKRRDRPILDPHGGRARPGHFE